MVFQFSSDDFEGEPKESDEGILRWFSFDKIPYHEMWQDDEYWLPLILEGKMFDGDFYFNEDGSELLRHSISLKNQVGASSQSF
jgi:8-oxo-dGTP diphosphatase